jgi:hypothetical protein
MDLLQAQTQQWKPGVEAMLDSYARLCMKAFLRAQTRG